MPFDWKAFFVSEAVPYRIAGSNVKRGNVNICCPFCGDDNGYHLGCNPVTGYWACWRNPSHRSKDPARLIKAFNKTPAEIAALLDEGAWAAGATLEGLTKQASLIGVSAPRITPSLVTYPPTFAAPTASGLRARFCNYLEQRGFSASDVLRIVAYYHLQGALGGEWHDRLIFPFLYKGAVVGWQGRSIRPAAELRYKAYPADSTAKDMVYNYDHAARLGKALAIVEGPIDTVKLDWYGRASKVRAVGILSTSASERQIELLLRLAAGYPRTYICLDPAAMGQAMALAARLAIARPRLVTVEAWGAEDPGALSPVSACLFAKSLIT